MADVNVHFLIRLAFVWICLGSVTQAAGLNGPFGIELWKSPVLWQDDAEETAKRLKLEGANGSYQAFYSDETFKILGAQAFGIQINGDKGKVNEAVVSFLNRADMEDMVFQELLQKEEKDLAAQLKKENKPLKLESVPQEKQNEIRQRVLTKTEKRIQEQWDKDLEAVKKALNGSAGKMSKEENGASVWLYAGHKLTLVESKDGVSLRIQKPQSAVTSKQSQKSKTANRARDASRNVERRGNGDVVITGLPAISQGNRSYCTTATWQKLLRYYGVSKEIFELAEQGGTTTTGTDAMQFTAKMTPELEEDGFQVVMLKGGPDKIPTIKAYIDQGVPVIWNMDARDLALWVLRNPERKSSLPKRSFTKDELEKYGQKEQALHTLLVVGYNARYKELALSDSTQMGHGEPEIWVTLEEAKKAHEASSGNHMVAVAPDLKGATASSMPGQVTIPGKKYY